MNPSLVRFYVAIVGSPLIEELFFRGFFQNSIGYFQRMNHRVVNNRNPTENENKTDMIFRVRMTALIYGGFYLFRKSNMTPLVRLLAFTGATLSGLGNGYLYERFGSLSAPLIAHTIHNLLIVSTLSPFNFLSIRAGVTLFLMKSSLLYDLVTNERLRIPQI